MDHWCCGLDNFHFFQDLLKLWQEVDYDFVDRNIVHGLVEVILDLKCDHGIHRSLPKFYPDPGHRYSLKDTDSVM